MTPHTKIKYPSRSPEEKASHELIKFGLQVGVKRVPSALAEELDTIWARPLNEITFAKRRKTRLKPPASENVTSAELEFLLLQNT